MVTRQIGEDSSGKIYPPSAVLVKRVRTYLHKSRFTTFFRHFSQQLGQSDRIRSGISSSPLFINHYIFYGTNQSGFVSESGCHSVEERSDGRFTVSPCDSDNFQPFGGMPITKHRPHGFYPPPNYF